MRALQYRTFGSPPEVVEIPKPRPGPGQVVLRVTAAGVCHSDELIMSRAAEEYRYGPLPLTLGHEAAGIVEAVGQGVTDVAEGEAVVVYGPWGCGVCRNCGEGKENYCLRPGGPQPPGIAVAGAMADYLLVDHQRHLVPLGDLDPVSTVALTDAGLTSYHAIKRALPRLGSGGVAVVLGAGGLGHLGIQILRAMSSAEVIALDVNEKKLDLAREVGAHHAILSHGNAAERIRSMTDGRGADVVVDFVGAQATVDVARAVAAIEAEVSIVGVGDGVLPVGVGAMAYDVAVRRPFWGSRPELIEVVELARRGHLHAEVERYSLEDGPAVYEKLAAGQIRGRAVLVPD